MSHVRKQAVIEAPIEQVWDPVGDPRRRPEWLPRVVEVNGERFEDGDRYAQVTREPNGKHKHTNFVIERMDDLREIRFACQQSGMYAHWLLTDAQGDTFVEVEMGMQPERIQDKVPRSARFLAARTAGRRSPGQPPATAGRIVISSPSPTGVSRPFPKRMSSPPT